MIDEQLLSILSCPETKKDLELVDQATIDQINEKITSKKIRNRDGEVVDQPIEAGLFRVGDKTCFYPIRNGVPIILIEELISLQQN